MLSMSQSLLRCVRDVLTASLKSDFEAWSGGGEEYSFEGDNNAMAGRRD